MTRSPIPQPLANAIEALKECADSLQAEIDGRYNGTQDKYPDQMRRYQRDIEPVTQARKSLAALEAFAEKYEADLKAWNDAEDKPLPEDGLIEAAMPYNDGDYKRHAEAHRLVGAKYSKSSLVALVNWLLSRITEKDEATRQKIRAEILDANDMLKACEACGKICAVDTMTGNDEGNYFCEACVADWNQETHGIERAEKDEGMTLPDLGDDAKITLFWPDTDKENGMDCFVCHYHRQDKKSIYAEGSSPRAAVLSAQAQIPKQDGGK